MYVMYIHTHLSIAFIHKTRPLLRPSKCLVARCGGEGGIMRWSFHEHEWVIQEGSSFGQKPRGSFTRGAFRKGVRVPIGVSEKGVCGRVQAGGWGWFSLWEMREREGGVESGGWRGDRQRNQQVNAHAFVKTTVYTIYPLLSPRIVAAFAHTQTHPDETTSRAAAENIRQIERAREIMTTRSRSTPSA